MRTAIIAFAVLLTFSASGRAEVPGESWTDDELLLAAGARPLWEIGDDVIRFTAESGRYNGASAVIDLRAPAGAWAVGVVKIFRPEGDDRALRLVSSTEFELSRGDYRALAAIIDEGVADQAAWTPGDCGPDCTEVREVCVDGNSVGVERFLNGRTVRLEPWGPGGDAIDRVGRRLVARLPAPIAGAIPYLTCFS